MTALLSTDLSPLLISLFKGVLYREDNQPSWQKLIEQQAAIRDYIQLLGLELIFDEAEGYAYLRQFQDEGDDEKNTIPKLIVRRQLSYPVSLLLALLRKRLAEFDASSGETRLILSRTQLIELLRLFLPDSSNEARLVDRIDNHIAKVVELGFLRKLRGQQEPLYEVLRILKAFVDAQWLNEFDQRLAEYAALNEDEGE
ncbi:Uncharacterised protein [Oligella ureolytica]|uniref:DUF4194 domain-containing protein n=1 Tax=Oligella ureolytica TaxID=90244 RepID=A0A378XCH2_9BURK|nr:DUF4194 domain-containing protein [Oligella ureolytica]NLB32103.1 DUF4194 domain-containing protein [Alcaligenaceae bacterium]HZJ96811.1 DUF4194 domain-containing protein [Oligella sp.]QPT40349.1 DUF4194 domain-containing protein [Oligella ureolytica]SUA50775.1 Uncharacterised protein [Oligella ureolytica]SUA59205.1 Uncharacterised protein [Oligella ureolytica]